MLATICAAVLAPQINIHVDTQAPCAPGNGSSTAPYCRVADALAAASEGDTILIAPGIYSEWLEVDKDISLVGAGQGVTTISGLGARTVVTIDPGKRVYIEGVTIAHGFDETGPGIAGGILSEGELTLVDSIVRACHAEASFPDWGGAAIMHDSVDRLIVRGCTFTGNTSLNTTSLTTGPVTLRGTGAVLFEECTFTANDVRGCCAINGNGGELIVRRCSIYQNDATQSFGPGAAILANTSLRLEASTVHNNIGTGVFIGSGGGPFIVDGCTITENTGSGVFANGIEAFPFTVEIGNTVLERSAGASMTGNFVSHGGNYLGASEGALFTITADPTDVVRVTGIPLPSSGLLPLADNGRPHLDSLAALRKRSHRFRCPGHRRVR